MTTTTAQLQHLWAASHALAATAPAVSAHLVTRLLKLSHEKGINLAETTSRQVCTACGTVAIPGVNSHVYTARNRRRKRKASKRTGEKPNTHCPQKKGGGQGTCDTTTRPQGISKLRVVFECRACGRSRSQDVPPPKPKSPSRARPRLATGLDETPARLPPPTAPNESQTPTQSQNASSRKRAKSRKGNTLSDILAAKRRQDSSSGARGNGVGGFGLDLMDLMKSG